jgi:protein-disulfide isomerase
VITACGGSLPPQAPVATGAVDAPIPAAKAGEGPAPEDDSAVPVRADDATWGSRTAWATVVVFSDLQCPYCAKAAATLQELRGRYGPESLRIVFKHNPLGFHPHARPAAEIAQGVLELGGEAAFWRYHEIVLHRQRMMDEDLLLDWGAEAGVSAAELEAGYRARRWAAKIDRDMDLARALDMRGTPMFLVNGALLSGAQPIEKFEAIIDEQIALAKAHVERGGARDHVYAERAALNRAAAAARADELERAAPRRPPPPDRVDVALPASAPSRGAKGAKVVIQEFADFQCPFCARVEATLDDLLAAYPTDVRVVWRDMPLASHDDAPLAAEAAREAFAQKGNDGFWRMQRRLLAAQRAPAGLERDALRAHARAAGLDVARFDAALDARTHRAAVDADAKAAAAAGIDATPAFVINGHYLTGAQPLARFRQLVERALAEAR